MFWNFTSDTVLIILLGIINLLYNGSNHYVISKIDANFKERFNTHESLNQIKVYVSQRKFDYEMDLYAKLVACMYTSFNSIGMIAENFYEHVAKNSFINLLPDKEITFSDYYVKHITFDLNQLITFHGEHSFQFSKQIQNNIDEVIELNSKLKDNIFNERNKFITSKMRDKQLIKEKVTDVFLELIKSTDRCNDAIREDYRRLDIKD